MTTEDGIVTLLWLDNLLPSAPDTGDLERWGMAPSRSAPIPLAEMGDG